VAFRGSAGGIQQLCLARVLVVCRIQRGKMRITKILARREIPQPLSQPTTLARPLYGNFRRLDFESLEHRLYLAVDVDSATADTTNLMATVTDPAVVNSKAPGPYLKIAPAMNFSSVSSAIEIPLHAENALSKPIVFVAENPEGQNAVLNFHVLTINPAQGKLIIRPVPGFVGTVQMRVGIRAADQPESSIWFHTQMIAANVVEDKLVADLSLTATKPDGSPLANLRAGDEFILHVWAQDLRTNPKGIFAAYLNMQWNGDLAKVTGDLTHHDRFGNGPKGDLSHSGSILEAGGFGGLAPSNGRLFEVFSVPMQATADGDLIFTTSRPLNIPAHSILAYGLDGEIDPLAVRFGQLSLRIGQETPGNRPNESGPLSLPEPSPLISIPALPEMPTILAISDDSNVNRFAVNILKLLTPAMQAEIANSSVVNNQQTDSDGSSLPEIDRETDLAVVSRKSNSERTADTLDDQAITAKIDLSLL
jgi:hypothetical protein